MLYCIFISVAILLGMGILLIIKGFRNSEEEGMVSRFLIRMNCKY